MYLSTLPRSFASLVLSVVCLILLSSAYSIDEACSQGYGAPVGGHPSWQERVMVTAVNACRLAPQDFKTDHVHPTVAILQPALFPVTHPLRWSECLNVIARFHSEDMATCDWLQHNSCDGTTKCR